MCFYVEVPVSDPPSPKHCAGSSSWTLLAVCPPHTPQEWHFDFVAFVLSFCFSVKTQLLYLCDLFLHFLKSLFILFWIFFLLPVLTLSWLLYLYNKSWTWLGVLWCCSSVLYWLFGIFCFLYNFGSRGQGTLDCALGIFLPLCSALSPVGAHGSNDPLCCWVRTLIRHIQLKLLTHRDLSQALHVVFKSLNNWNIYCSCVESLCIVYQIVLFVTLDSDKCCNIGPC